ncbi:MAG: beta-xylosidase family glycoside hydrolase [Acidobacteriaceae bacterium]
MKIHFLRGTLFSAVPLVCAVSMTATQAFAQQTRGWSAGHVENVVFDGSMQAGWYSFPGQSPKLRFKGDQVRIKSREHSTVLLSRDADASGTAAEVELTRAPKSTSSISGLGLVGDASHAVVIGLGDGSIVLWQLEPNSARVLARQPVNTDSQFEFRVSGSAGDVRFFWRHQGDSAWHPLGNAAVSRVLTAWQEPLRFGLLLDGPQGSEVVFSNYRASLANEASASLPPLAVAGQ